MKRIARVLLCCCIALIACGARYGTELPPPPNVVQITGDQYEVIWRMVEACSGKRSSFHSVKWYAYWDATIPMPDGTEAMAVAYPERRVVVLARPNLTHFGVLAHEAGHLVASPGYHDPDIYQRGPCAQIMVCWSTCLTDTLRPRRVASNPGR